MTIHKTIVVNDPMGLHLRSAAKLINKLSQFKSTIVVCKGQISANAKSIIGLMTLEAGPEAKLEFIIDGFDAEAAINAVLMFFQNASTAENPVYSETVFS